MIVRFQSKELSSKIWTDLRDCPQTFRHVSRRDIAIESRVEVSVRRSVSGDERVALASDKEIYFIENQDRLGIFWAELTVEALDSGLFWTEIALTAAFSRKMLNKKTMEVLTASMIMKSPEGGFSKSSADG